MKFRIDEYQHYYYVSYYDYNSSMGKEVKLPLLCTRDIAKGFGLTVKTMEKLIANYKGIIKRDRPYFRYKKDAQSFIDMLESLETMRVINGANGESEI